MNHYQKAETIFKNAIPNDSLSQYTAESFINELITEKVGCLLDLGCGNGNSADFLSNFCDRYIGVDIGDSPESLSRIRNDFEYTIYDGINLPFKESTIDIVYMKQVLEHILEPHRLFPEIYRVLRKNGSVIGSVSQLEPFHSYSIFNYTPYGLCAFLDLFNIEVYCLRPSIDGMTLLNRTLNKFILSRGSNFEDIFWEVDSPLNYQLKQILIKKNKAPYDINLSLLNICGQFCFAARKR